MLSLTAYERIISVKCDRTHLCVTLSWQYVLLSVNSFHSWLCWITAGIGCSPSFPLAFQRSSCYVTWQGSSVPLDLFLLGCRAKTHGGHRASQVARTEVTFAIKVPLQNSTAGCKHVSLVVCSISSSCRIRFTVDSMQTFSLLLLCCAVPKIKKYVSILTKWIVYIWSDVHFHEKVFIRKEKLWLERENNSTEDQESPACVSHFFSLSYFQIWMWN